jgi:RHS repeat-associated protein
VPNAEPAPDGGIAPPTISLPKGGGAIRGLGETFSPDPVTGAGTLAVPVAVPPGRSGFGPELTLRYHSGAGNGPFGYGWELPLPEITRRTDRGLPRYAGSDTFLLTGAEELVPVLVRDDDGGWRIDEQERDGHRVRRYRPRTEGMFARIERWTRLADGDVHWRSISRSNVLTVYGLDPGSRVADPDDPGRRVFGWKICASYDDRGNAIVYDYAAEDGSGVDPAAANERARVRGANRYLKRIRYGNRVPLLLDPAVPGMRASHLPPPDHDSAGWLFELVLDYGEGHYQELPPEPDGEVPVAASLAPQTFWSARLDPFSSYRAGFEVRTHRLCRRILTFHHFPDELGTGDYLVRSVELRYRETPTGSFLSSVASAGHRRHPDGRYRTRSLPALELGYATSPLADPPPDGPGFQVRTVAAAAVANLPAGVDGAFYRWVDLDGEGIPGALTEQAGAWFFKPNLGGGRLGRQRRVATVPAATALDAGAAPLGGPRQLVDVAGNGQLDLVDFAPGAPGFYPRTEAGGWHPFRPFRSWPNRVWADPNLRFVDLTGDGLVDVLVTEDACLSWHPGLAEAGFGPAVRVRTAAAERGGPRVVFADPAQSIHLADMSGDGLADLVRVRNGEVCYWPNLGYGRFGPKVTMDRAPVLDRPEAFDQRRVHLADTDGSGPTDLVYLGRDRVRVFLNESGNGWSSARVLPALPSLDGAATVSVVDLLGRGTACLVWSSPLPGHARAPLRYLDLTTGHKPHLLVSVRNNLGAETVVEYAASTEFALADAAAGQPWITRLPFPVQVVTRVETYDRIGRNRFVSRASYHHGYFDPAEREFRGFARVDTLDTEQLAALTSSGAFPAGDNLDAASHVPPVLTRSWYHTGVHLAGERVSRLLAQEYHQDPVSQLPDTVLPDELSAEEVPEACRALKGGLLRREVYAQDGRAESVRPYTVTEQSYRLRRLQPRRGGQPAVFLPHPGEALELHYERRAEPRVAHALTLRVDDFGTVTLAAGVGYRRAAGDPSLAPEERAVQQRTSVTFTVRTPTNPVSTPDTYRAPAVAETRTYQLRSPVPAAGARFEAEQLRALVEAAGDGGHDLPYHDLAGAGAAGGEPFRRLIEAERTRFRRDDLTGPLPLGTLESLALPLATHRLVLTAELAAVRYLDPGRLPAADLEPALTEAGYLHSEGDPGWWAPTSQVFYSSSAADSPAQELATAVAHFFRPRRYRDPFGHQTTVDYDPHDLLPVRARDPLGNLVSAGERDPAGTVVGPGNDYRVLEPSLVMDPNRNRTAAGFDTLGLVAGTAVMGKPEEALGDSLAGFDPDGTELGTATSRLVYDLSGYARTAGDPAPSPVVVQTITRETHHSELPPGQTPVVRRRYAYSDGFGRVVQQKAEAEPGPLVAGGPVGPRWLATGWTIYDNKGQPVREYQPFFDDTPAFRFGHLVGVSPITCYDPVGRVVAKLHPDHGWEKLVIEPWRQQVWDRNDTVAIADPAADPDVGDFLARLPAASYSPTWAQARAGGELGAAEQAAATQAGAHAGTPATRYLDPLGRTFLTVTHNRIPAPGGGPPVDLPQRARIVLDVEGNQLALVDPEGRTFARYEHDLAGHRVALASLDGGTRWTLADPAGRPVRGGDESGHRFRTEYDPLRRAVRRFVTGTTAESDPDTTGGEVLFETVDYGEGQPDPEARNLRTRMFRSRDGGGVVVMDRYDFKGNLLATTQQLVADHRITPDWSQPPALAPEVFTNTTTFDALDRAVTVTTPDGSVTRPRYDPAGQLAGIDVELDGVATGFVSGIDYDPQGRRTRVRYGNGAVTEHRYHPVSQRLARTVTTRPAIPDPAGGSLFTTPERVQDRQYTYDPAGNLVRLADLALRTVFHDGQQVQPVWRYTYDAAYRLVEATGREHVAQSGFAPPGGRRDHPFTGTAALADLQALRGYTERYRYDRAGNLTRVTHLAAGGDWTRDYHYSEPNPLEPGQVTNRLTATSTGTPATVEPYPHDRRGAITAMPHLPLLRWDFRERLVASAGQVVSGGGTPETTYYGYSGGGQRVRKVTERGNGTRRAERLYLRGCEIYREYAGDGGTVTLARQTLHVADGEQRIALVETETTGGDPAPVLRFQLADPLGSVAAELDRTGALITYEEHTPYGPSAFQAGRSGAEVSLKRYRYAGRERDEETGLSYHGQRYLAPWLGRWLSCDPAGPVDGPNLYEYARSNPIGYQDPAGTRATPAERVRDPLPEPALDGGPERRAEQGTGERAPPAEPEAPPGAPPDPPPPAPDAQPGAGAGAAKQAQPGEEPEQPEPPPESGPASQPASGPAGGADQPADPARPGQVDPAAPADRTPDFPAGEPAPRSAPTSTPAPSPATRPAGTGGPATEPAPASEPSGPTLFGIPLASAIMFAVTVLTFLAIMLLTLDQGVSSTTWWVRGIVTGAWAAGAITLGIIDIVLKTGGGGIDEPAFDRWSIIHGGFGVVAGLWGIPFPVVAVITVLWEVFEAKFHGFGEGESWGNRVVDVGVAWVGWIMFAGGVSLFDPNRRPMPWLVPARESWARDRWLKLF